MADMIQVGGVKVDRLKLARNGLQTAKINFTNQYEPLSLYFYQIKSEYQPYTPQIPQGQFLNSGNINDNIGAKSAKLMASALMGMVWKDEKGTFRIVRSRNIPESEESKGYFKRVTDNQTLYMERPKSRLTTSLFTSILESVIYGTSGMVTQAGDFTTPLKFSSQSVLTFYLVYDKDGEIVAVFIDYNLSADELWDKYGDAAGSGVAQAIQNNDHTRRFVVTEAIRPRSDADAAGMAGKLGMPLSSDLFMPYDNIYLEEGGYESMPLAVLFHEKLSYEDYGRGPGMDALPTVVQINVASEVLAIGGELTAQPSLAMYDNGSLAGLAVDLSAGALNVFNVSGSVPTEKPIVPIFQVGDLRVMLDWYGKLQEDVKGFFLLDKLYDLNIKQRMTLGEALMREQIRADSLSPIFTRTMAFLTQVIERSIDITFGMGLLGVADPENLEDPKVQALLRNGIKPFAIPADILEAQVNGIDWYEIEFISPAARIMNTEELNSTLKFISVMAEAGALSPDFIDVIDPDGTAEKLRKLTATDTIVVRTQAHRDQIREARARAQMEVAKIEVQAKLAQANQSNAQADAARSGAVRTMAEIGT